MVLFLTVGFLYSHLDVFPYLGSLHFKREDHSLPLGRHDRHRKPAGGPPGEPGDRPRDHLLRPEDVVL